MPRHQPLNTKASCHNRQFDQGFSLAVILRFCDRSCCCQTSKSYPAYLSHRQYGSLWWSCYSTDLTNEMCLVVWLLWITEHVDLADVYLTACSSCLPVTTPTTTSFTHSLNISDFHGTILDTNRPRNLINCSMTIQVLSIATIVSFDNFVAHGKQLQSVCLSVRLPASVSLCASETNSCPIIVRWLTGTLSLWRV